MVKLFIGVLIVTIIGLVAFTVVPKVTDMFSNQTAQTTQAVDDGNKLTIGITGEVVKPGNYILSENATLQDLIDKAGGVNNNADERAYYTEYVVQQNEEYYIAPKYDVKDICSETSISKININSCDKETLMSVSGFGDAVSTQLINYRAENGVFYCLEEIKNVKGIGNATFEKVKNYIYLHD